MRRFFACVIIFATSSSAFVIHSPRTSARSSTKTSEPSQVSSPRTHDVSANGIFDGGVDTYVVEVPTEPTLEEVQQIDSEVRNIMESMIATADSAPKKNSRPTAIAFEPPEIDSVKRRVTSTLEPTLEEVQQIDSEVRNLMESMIATADSAPKKNSRPTAIAFEPPEIDSVKRRVTSTLASDMAKTGKILMQEPGPQRVILKPPAVIPPVKKSPFVERLVKKIFMPWKSFYSLS
jgi:predicted regulator of Ras-like GTPase activity (Roadblock/LC7/MglB family)